jgi:hypothetical protein
VTQLLNHQEKQNPFPGESPTGKMNHYLDMEADAVFGDYWNFLINIK